MKHTIRIFSLLLVLIVPAFAQTPVSQPKGEELTKDQLKALIAAANTPAEHQRIADYYGAQAGNYRAQAEDHKAMIAAYRQNSNMSNSRNWASTIGHCQYFVKTFSNMAVKSEELARQHTQMAKDAGHPAPASRLGK